MKSLTQIVARCVGASICVTLFLGLQLCIATGAETTKRNLDAPYTPNKTIVPDPKPAQDVDLPFNPARVSGKPASPERQPATEAKASKPRAAQRAVDQTSPRNTAATKPKSTRDLDSPFKPTGSAVITTSGHPVSAKATTTAPQTQPVEKPTPPLPNAMPRPDNTPVAPAAPLVGVKAEEKAPSDFAPFLDRSYTLGSGDRLRLVIFGEEDLSGEFVVDGTGYVRMPLIGEVMASGFTALELEAQIAARLRARYMKDPKVNVEITRYRPFYIVGEVNNPGEYPFVTGMSVLNAVAIAGGYTFRARDSVVYVRRKGSKDELDIPADHTSKVWPGDIIRVGERWF